MKFTAEWAKRKCYSLTIILNGTILHTDLYTNPQYLLPSSCHPRHCMSSIHYSWVLWLRRICPRGEDFQKNAKLREAAPPTQPGNAPCHNKRWQDVKHPNTKRHPYNSICTGCIHTTRPKEIWLAAVIKWSISSSKCGCSWQAMVSRGIAL